MRISKNELDSMFLLAGLDKESLYDSLRKMGRKHVRTKLLKDEWTSQNPTKNYCYVIAEFVWFYLAPSGSKPYSLKVPGDNGLHRFVKWPDGTIVDLAVEQFFNYEDVDYSKATVRYPMQSGCIGPSKRARILATHLGFDENNWKNPDKERR